jgi:hypothetical protein
MSTRGGFQRRIAARPEVFRSFRDRGRFGREQAGR